MKRGFRIVLIAWGIGMILTQFQNCANPGSLDDSGGSTVHLIGDVTKAGIEFPQTSVQLFDNATTAYLGGLCAESHDGEVLTWSLVGGGSIVAQGNSTCSEGQFALNLAEASQLVCGVSYDLSVSTSWGGSAQTVVTKLCPPIASATLPEPAVAENGQPQNCQLEYRLSDDGSNQGLCQAVCYSENVETYFQEQPLDACSQLISQASASAGQ